MIRRLLSLGLAVGSAAFLSGCGTSNSVTAPTSPVPGVALHGLVHGGQQPVSGSSIQLYAASTTGYAGTATPLLSSAVTTDANGDFSISGAYACTGDPLVYIVATGGNPGLGAGNTNPNLALMTALGSCSQLQSASFITINELTTVASVYALAPFMSGITQLGTSATNITGLRRAFATVNKLVDVSSGVIPGPALPANAVFPTALLNTVADILATCVNSGGGAAGDLTSCGQLFGNAPGPAQDTISSALWIATNPQGAVTTLYNLVGSTNPFAPTLISAPADWTLAINYTGAGLQAPGPIAVDANGNVWAANPAANTLSELSSTGAPISPATGFTGLQLPSAIAADTSGNVWVTNQGDSSITQVSPSGTIVQHVTGGGLSAPTALAIDAVGNIWVANSTASVVSGFTSTGVPLLPSGFTTSGAAPSAIAIASH